MNRFFLKSNIILSLFFFGIFFSYGQEYNGSKTLISQAEVNDFGAMGYTSITGNFVISGNDITDLTPLSSFIDVGYFQIIDNPILTSISGLENVTNAGYVIIHDNPALISCEGLSNLTSIYDELNLLNNDALTQIGMNSLTSVGGKLSIRKNNNLVSLDGLNNLTSVGNNSSSVGLFIQLNNSLTTTLGLNSLTSIGTGLYIAENPALTDYCSISSVAEDLSLLYYTLEANAYNPSQQDFIDNLCVPLTIEENKGMNTIQIYPNPTSNVVHMEFTSGDSKNLSVINSLGQIAYQKDNITSAEYTFHLDAPIGIYTIEVISGQTKKQFKIVKQ